MSFSIGPIAFPFQPFWLLLSYWLAIWLAAKWAGPERAQAAKNLAQSTPWVGLIASRFVYLALHATLYVDNPWAVIDIRDGGWHAPSGVVHTSLTVCANCSDTRSFNGRLAFLRRRTAKLASR